MVYDQLDFNTNQKNFFTKNPAVTNFEPVHSDLSDVHLQQ